MSVVTVRPMATGRVTVAAYELSGPELSQLQREARWLCPQGGDILRQSSQDQRPAEPEGRMSVWTSSAREWLNPPKRSAQMLVVCKEAPDAAALPSLASLTSAAASAVAATTPASAAAATSNPAPAAAAAPLPLPQPLPLGPIAVD